MDVKTGAQLWGAGYERKISDVIAVKQAIAREIAERLKLKLSGEEQRRLVKRDSTNPEVYQFYLRGRYFWNKRTPDGIKRAFEQFQQAIERDPNFALGYVGLAGSLLDYVLQSCGSERSHAKGKRIGRQGAGTGRYSRRSARIAGAY